MIVITWIFQQIVKIINMLDSVNTHILGFTLWDIAVCFMVFSLLFEFLRRLLGYSGGGKNQKKGVDKIKKNRE